ncbi:hypothetical protein [Akkermansia sp.]|uniref:hypothetical protein n=1 Tax=Akkermansia sp. TaxID=1872421 RepID=UPI0025C283E2|nr:hypothetical protein [Akkermansia sp.]MCD8064649.1 hypothetical protein [Akkermansia sp.]
MEYMNIPTALFSSPEFIGAEPVQRATWIALLAWCCEQENGGIIEGCRSWGMRRWMQTCGVTDQEICDENELYHFDGDNLIVFGYPHEIQETLEVKRKIARENGKLGGRPKKTHVETNIGTNTETEEKPTSVSKKTYVGSEIGTEIETNVQNRKKERKEERNIGGEITTVDSTPGGESPAAPVLPAPSFPNRERLNDVRGMRCADNHADLGASPGAARFIAATLEINPSWSRTLLTAIEQAAALEAYQSAQGRVTPRDMEMLRAYYASGLTHDRSNKAFWRPDSRRKFWECFGDVLTHADRWAKETRWKPAAARKKPKTEQAPQQPEGPVVETDTAAAEIRELREEMGLGGEA